MIYIEPNAVNKVIIRETSFLNSLYVVFRFTKQATGEIFDYAVLTSSNISGYSNYSEFEITAEDMPDGQYTVQVCRSAAPVFSSGNVIASYMATVNGVEPIYVQPNELTEYVEAK